MARDRDVEAFAERAPGYESGWLGKLHRDIADRVVDIALACSPTSRRILDVGCGTGYLLRQVAARAPDAVELVGIDAAAAMIEVARAKDQFSAWLLPTLLGSRSGKARTKARATRLIVAAGLHGVEWHDLYAVIIRAATATK
jgi:predicted TPR repeat methyltransferase